MNKQQCKRQRYQQHNDECVRVSTMFRCLPKIIDSLSDMLCAGGRHMMDLIDCFGLLRHLANKLILQLADLGHLVLDNAHLVQSALKLAYQLGILGL
jgi:hypothetical protein